MHRRSFLLGLPFAAAVAAPMAQAVAAEIAKPIEPVHPAIPKFVDSDKGRVITVKYEDLYRNSIINHRPAAEPHHVLSYVAALSYTARQYAKLAREQGRSLRLVYKASEISPSLPEGFRLPGGRELQYLASQTFVINDDGTVLVHKDRLHPERTHGVYRL